MNEPSTEQMQSLLLEAFKFTLTFLEQHGLRYIASGGTVLGAVRHKGFIPWDDDIDIYMPRKDYDKLFSYINDFDSTDYELISYNNNHGYYYPFAKISNKNTTIWEIETLPFVFGVFVDIFPIDYFSEDSEYITNMKCSQSELFYTYYVSSIRKYTFRNILSSLLHFDVPYLAHFVLNKYRSIFSLSYLKKFIETEKSYSGNKGEKCVCVTQDGVKIFNSKWFEDVIQVPFEDTMINIPREYDKYLSLLYGDYMTPPPVDKRKTHHLRYYINLDKRLSVEEILEEKKQLSK